MRFDPVKLVLLVTLLVASSASAQFDPPPADFFEGPADLVLTNGRIHTPAGWSSALAVSGNVIIALGDENSVAQYSDDNTRVIDLEGATVLPGLHDMHVHPALAGFEELSCKISHESSLEQIFDIVASCVSKVAPDQWVVGRAYDPEAFGEGLPHKSMLDRVAPDNPVLLNDISGHTAWVNSKALELAGYTRDTPNPEGGILERDEDGAPTGLLHEAAMGPVYAIIPKKSREAYAQATKWALDRMLANGITALVDASTNEPDALAYADLADQGILKQRVRGCLWAADENVLLHRNLYLRDRFKPDCVKIFLDGVPTDSHTAAMLDEYMPKPGQDDEGRENGILMIPVETVTDMVVRFDSMGLVVKFHSAGDMAVRTALDAIEQARKVNGLNGLRHNPGHDSFVHMSDIRRAKEIGATLEFSPYIWAPSPIVVNIDKAIGSERMERFYPLKDSLDAGVHTVVGSDWPVVPFVNPWIAIESMVTRQVPGGSEESVSPSEAITREQAIDMFTIDAARQLNSANYTGSLEVGKLADFVVLNQNVFEVPVTDLHKTKTLKTFIDGEEVYSAE
jgi:predicted amidohydrolase YtcJ